MKKIVLAIIISIVSIQIIAQTNTEGGGDAEPLARITKPNAEIPKMVADIEAEKLRVQYHKVFREWGAFSINLFSLLKYLGYPFKNPVLQDLTKEGLNSILEPFLKYDTTSSEFALDNKLNFNGKPLTFYSSSKKVIMNPKRWHNSFKVKTEEEGRKTISAALALFIHEALVIDGKESTLDFSITKEVSDAYYTVIADPNGWIWMEKRLPTIIDFKNIQASCSSYNDGAGMQNLYDQIQFLYEAHVSHRTFRKTIVRVTEISTMYVDNLVGRDYFKALSLVPIHNVPFLTNSLADLLSLFDRFDENCIIASLPEDRKNIIMDNRRRDAQDLSLLGKPSKIRQAFVRLSW